MTMKKTTSSEGFVVCSKEEKFPVGFRYRLGSVDYTVVKTSTSNGTGFRELISSEGLRESIALHVLEKDSQSSDYEVLEPKKVFKPGDTGEE